MQIFLTGATGYIGSAVLGALIKGGHQVTAIARDPEKAERLLSRGAMPIIGDLGVAKTYADAVRSSDVVVHTAFESSPRTVEIDRQVIDTVLAELTHAAAIDGKPRAFVYTSGIWVLGKTTRPVAEDAPLNPAEISAWRAPHEQLVLTAHTEGVRTMVVRPGIVYGGGRGIVSDLLKDALNGLVRVVGSGKNHWPCVYGHDLADLYVRLAQSPGASGVYHANDEADETVNEIVDAVCDHLSQRPDVRHMPLAEARKKMGPYADALALDQRVRSPRAHALGWSPTQHGIAGSVARLLEEFRGSRS